jgi:hypothetical protein
MGIAEHYPRIDLARLRRDREWSEGTTLEWVWRTARATITPRADGIEVQLAGSQQAQSIAFTETPCRFGGVRRWFRCPSCDCGCRVMYNVRLRFACRRCHGLNYRSQHEKFADGALRRARAIIARLSGEEPKGFPPYDFPPKPPRMHWKTYWRLQERTASLERRGVEALEASVQRMTERSRAALAAFDDMKARIAT